jgi:hypothetical protein
VQKIEQNLYDNQLVHVLAEDYGKDPVAGKLITLNHDRITINRDDSEAGNVNVHFPRAGFRVIAVES